MKNIKTLSCSITNLNFSEEHGDKMCLIDIEAMKYITFSLNNNKLSSPLLIFFRYSYVVKLFYYCIKKFVDLWASWSCDLLLFERLGGLDE